METTVEPYETVEMLGMTLVSFASPQLLVVSAVFLPTRRRARACFVCRSLSQKPPGHPEAPVTGGSLTSKGNTHVVATVMPFRRQAYASYSTLVVKVPDRRGVAMQRVTVARSMLGVYW